MYANTNDYILWLFKQWWVYHIFLLGQHRFQNDTFYAIKQWVQVPLAIRKVRKIEVQGTSINLKVVQKEKIKQTKLLGYLEISIYVKNISMTKIISLYIK